MSDLAHDEYANRTFPQGFWAGWQQFCEEWERDHPPVAQDDPEIMIFWAQARAEHRRFQMVHCPRHLVVDRFSYDPGEIGVTTSDGVW